MKNGRLFLIFNIFLFCLVPQPSQPCTTFSLEHADQHVVGKNYDWIVGDGLVVVNKRGVSKTAIYIKEENAQLASWTSKYGSVTFNQHGREMPHGGMNETGLVVQAMMLTETKYPAPDSRPAISRLQWIQYQLDNFSTVKEIIASDSILRISPGGGSGPHFLCIDREGNYVSIEFLDGKLVYHTKETMPFGVLTNSTYEESVELYKTYKRMGKKLPMPGGNSSRDRFVRAASMIKRYNSIASKPRVNYAFDILSNVAQGSQTKWSIVFDIKNYRVYFETFSNPKRRYFDFNSFNLSCATPVKALDINAELEGDVTNNFQDYTQQINRNLIRNSFKKTPALRDVPEETLEYLTMYPEYTRCNQ